MIDKNRWTTRSVLFEVRLAALRIVAPTHPIRNREEQDRNTKFSFQKHICLVKCKEEHGSAAWYKYIRPTLPEFQLLKKIVNVALW
jgi:hypothetical protein